MNRNIIAVMLLLTVTLDSCAGTTVKPNRKAEGKWTMEISSGDIGMVRAIMEFRTDSNTFTAYSRKNADRDILGGWTSFLGRTFSGSFKEGRLLHIVDGKITEQHDSVILSGIFRSSLGNYHFNASIAGNKMNASLTTRSGKVYASILAMKEDAHAPLENYSLIFEKADSVTHEYIYDVSLLKSAGWKDFESKMRKISGKAQDDLEMVFAFYYYSRRLPFSHYSLMKAPPKENPAAAATGIRYVTLEEKTPKTAYMKISSFAGTAAEVDSMFGFVIRKGYVNLIADLRDNPGGSVEAGMAFAKNVSHEEYYGGVFLTQKWFRSHSASPSVDQYRQFPSFSAADFDLFISTIYEREGLSLKVIPAQVPYRGKLYILTNKNTASTCEPIVYGLRQNKLATVVGEKTAGVMLTGEFTDVGAGFKMMLPTADYYTADGYRIDQKGVAPDIQTKSEEALDYVLKNLIGK